MAICNISIKECKPQMVLAKDIYTDKGTVLMPEGTVLTDSIIEKISINKINRVWINCDNDLDDSPYIIETKKEYLKKIEKVKNLFNCVLTEESIVEQVSEISSSIINSDKTAGDLLRCIRGLKSMGDSTYTHSLNVASICCLMGTWMKLDKNQIEEVTIAGLIHDIGKLKISQEILNKDTDLTDAELLELKNHTIYGYEILKEKTNFSEDLLKGVLQHHEKEDGSGYPYGIKGNKINLIGKIVSVANLYSLITLDMIYKKAHTPFSIFEIFESPASQKFDTLTFYTLLSNISMYYIGDNVKLSNGKEGQIFYIDKEFISRPIIKLKDGTTFDTRKHKDVKIVKIS